jgi:hypothetical protein
LSEDIVQIIPCVDRPAFQVHETHHFSSSKHNVDVLNLIKTEGNDIFFTATSPSFISESEEVNPAENAGFF